MKNRPLADLLRPENLEDVIGQDHLFGKSGACIIPLSNGIDSGDFNLNKLNFKKLDFSQFKIQYRYINKEDLWFKFYMEIRGQYTN